MKNIYIALLVIIGLVGVYKVSSADSRIPTRFQPIQISRIGEYEIYRINDYDMNNTCYIVATSTSISCVKL
jgi:hypothetical protein